MESLDRNEPRAVTACAERGSERNCYLGRIQRKLDFARKVAGNDGRCERQSAVLLGEPIGRTRKSRLAAEWFIVFQILHPFRAVVRIGEQFGNLRSRCIDLYGDNI